MKKTKSTPFITENFLLSNDVARELYHDHAAGEPIHDYHCHLPPDQIAANKTFRNLYEVWLDGDHYKLAFDRPGTWSQKYNLVWDRILGLNLFPLEVARREMAYYRRVANRFETPFRSRPAWTVKTEADLYRI